MSRLSGIGLPSLVAVGCALLAGCSGDGASNAAPAISRYDVWSEYASPDGRLLAVVLRDEGSAPNGSHVLCWIDLAGQTRLHQLSVARLVQDADWFDDGTLAFIRVAEEPSDSGRVASQIWLGRPLRANASLLVEHLDQIECELSCRPSGRWLAVTRTRAEFAGALGCEVVLLDAEHRGSVAASWITRRGPYGLGLAWRDTPSALFFPLWEERHRNRIAQITVLANGSIEKDVLEAAHDVLQVYPDPAGRYIAYTHREPGGDPSAEALSVLDLTTRNEAVVVRGALTRQIALSPDGSAIAYLTGSRNDVRADLWVLDLDTQVSRRVARGVRRLLVGRPWSNGGVIMFLRGDAVLSIDPDVGQERLLVDLRAAIAKAGEQGLLPSADLPVPPLGAGGDER